MTIKDMLLKLGMQDHEIDNHYSDLYVKVNEISAKFVDEMQLPVSRFVCQRTNSLWFDIPFGYMSEYIQGKLQDRNLI